MPIVSFVFASRQLTVSAGAAAQLMLRLRERARALDEREPQAARNASAAALAIEEGISTGTVPSMSHDERLEAWNALAMLARDADLTPELRHLYDALAAT